MRPLILSRSLDRQAKGTVSRRVTPADEAHPAAPGQQGPPQPCHKFDPHKQSWKGAVKNQLDGICAQCVMCVYACVYVRACVERW